MWEGIKEIFSGNLVYTIMFGVALGKLLSDLINWLLAKLRVDKTT